MAYLYKIFILCVMSALELCTYLFTVAQLSAAASNDVAWVKSLRFSVVHEKRKGENKGYFQQHC